MTTKKKLEMFRGYLTYKRENGEWFFSDTNDRVMTTWKHRPCGYCGLANTVEGYDGCIGYLPKVRNACCGHGFRLPLRTKGTTAQAIHATAATMPAVMMRVSVMRERPPRPGSPSNRREHQQTRSHLARFQRAGPDKQGTLAGRRRNRRSGSPVSRRETSQGNRPAESGI